MLKRLLVPLDVEEMSDHVLPYVVLMAKQLDQPVHLLSVVPDERELGSAGARAGAALASLVQHQRDAAKRHLDSVRDELDTQGVSATTEVAAGSVPDQILEAIAAQQADVVAMATHGRSGIERWFVGSVTERVVRAAPVPVLVVRPREGGPAPQASVNEILLPLDGSELAEAAVPYATFLAGAFKAPVVVIRTLDLTWLASGANPYGADGTLSPELLEALEEDSKLYLEQMVTRLRGDGVDVRSRFAFGPPAAQITDTAHATPGTLVVMSTHGRTGLGRTLLGSVADRVVRSSEAPVLLIRGAD